jgi:hypothetical protein
LKLKKTVGRKFNMAYQLLIYLPGGASSVQVQGSNQDKQPATWTGTPQFDQTTPDNQQIFSASTNNWWWIGDVEILYTDSTGNIHAYGANVPDTVSLEPWAIAYCDVDPNSLTTGLLRLRTHSKAPPSTGREEKPRHGGHEEKPSHDKHEEKPSHGEREEKPSHEKHKEKPIDPIRK